MTETLKRRQVHQLIPDERLIKIQAATSLSLSLSLSLAFQIILRRTLIGRERQWRAEGDSPMLPAQLAILPSWWSVTVIRRWPSNRMWHLYLFPHTFCAHRQAQQARTSLLIIMIKA